MFFKLFLHELIIEMKKIILLFLILMSAYCVAQKPSKTEDGIKPVGIIKNLTDSALLDVVQRQTFRYFWDFGHPISGLARERSNATPDVVSSGGSGFGLMAILVGIERG